MNHKGTEDTKEEKKIIHNFLDIYHNWRLIGSTKLPPLDIDWKDPSLKVIDIQSLAGKIKTALHASSPTFTSTQFALEMIEGVQKVRFSRSSS
ncbi:MAG: hypothetical protein F6K47_43885 [Symploca sp. SIO2E6]|nr:hypothetical protein [Symploca sp. SIO2E6]